MSCNCKLPHFTVYSKLGLIYSLSQMMNGRTLGKLTRPPPFAVRQGRAAAGFHPCRVASAFCVVCYMASLTQPMDSYGLNLFSRFPEKLPEWQGNLKLKIMLRIYTPYFSVDFLISAPGEDNRRIFSCTFISILSIILSGNICSSDL